jgi:hypothetical protein
MASRRISSGVATEFVGRFGALPSNFFFVELDPFISQS